MTCWKCGAQTVDNTCTMCGCLQDTRLPAETPRGKSLRYIYDKLGPAATLTNPTNFIRCLGDIFPDDDEFRQKMAQVLQTNVGTHLYTMLSENKEIDEGAKSELTYIIRNKCSLPDQDISSMLYLLLDMVGCSKAQPSAATNSPSTATAAPSADNKPVEIKRPSGQSVSSATEQAQFSSTSAVLPAVGILVIVAVILIILFSYREPKNTPSTQVSSTTQTSSTSAAKSSNDGYIPAQQAIPYEFTLDGVTYTLPCPVSELLANGWQIYTYDENHGATYFSANDPVAPGEFGASPVSSVSTYIYKGSPGHYSLLDNSYQFSPIDSPELGVTINNLNSSTSMLKDCYITQITAFDFSDQNNFTFSWNGISLDSTFSAAERSIDALQQRIDVTFFYDGSNGYIGFGVTEALENYEIFIDHSLGLVDYIVLTHYVTPK